MKKYIESADLENLGASKLAVELYNETDPLHITFDGEQYHITGALGDYTYNGAKAMLDLLDSIAQETIPFYAVLLNDEDTDWGYGSFNFSEAQEMLEYKLSYYPGAYLAKIVGGVCEDEIYPSDIELGAEFSEDVKSEIAEITEKLHTAPDTDTYRRLCALAGITAAWDNADENNRQRVIEEAADRLGIDM